jgi:hypothetical protein
MDVVVEVPLVSAEQGSPASPVVVAESVADASPLPSALAASSAAAPSVPESPCAPRSEEVVPEPLPPPPHEAPETIPAVSRPSSPKADDAVREPVMLIATSVCPSGNGAVRIAPGTRRG